MLNVCLLGTGGMMPLPGRWLTSLLLRYNGSSILIDCGEGTQISMVEHDRTFKPIDVICFTHFHADHISGLPGILLAMANSGRTEPVQVIGPKGLSRVISGLCTIAPELPFRLELTEISGPEQCFELCGLRITAFRVQHRIACYGYTVEAERKGKFDVDRAKEAGIPLKYWSLLQKGNTIEDDGKVFTPDMVLGPQRKGLKVTYTTDTRPTASITEHAFRSDLFICEGMYGDPEKEENALAHKHMMMTEAAALAAEAEVGELWLTHYSPSMVRPHVYLKGLQKIFPGTVCGKDGMNVELNFEDD